MVISSIILIMNGMFSSLKWLAISISYSGKEICNENCNDQYSNDCIRQFSRQMKCLMPGIYVMVDLYQGVLGMPYGTIKFPKVFISISRNSWQEF